MPIDYTGARKLLQDAFVRVEADMLQGSVPKVNEQVNQACEALFASHTQAYREVLLGCILARIQDKSTNIRQPYADQGQNAFSGRSLDERVVNPFCKINISRAQRGLILAFSDAQ